MRRRIGGLLLVFGLGVWLAPSHSLAQEAELEGELDADPDDPADLETEAPEDSSEAATPSADATERARAEFAAGIACVEEHETACAEEHFRTALSLRDAPAIRYNLASALYDLRRYPEAQRLVDATLADPETPEDIRGHAEALQAQLAESGGTLQISLSGATDGAEIQVDGEAVPEPSWTATRVTAGSHTVAVTRQGMTTEEQIDIAVGATAEVSLTVVPTPEEVAAAETAAGDQDSGGEPSVLESWEFWAIAGGALALIAIVAISIVVAGENAALEEPLQGNYDPGVLRWD